MTTATLAEPMTIRDIRDDREALAALETRINALEVDRLRRCACHHCQMRLRELLGDAAPTIPEGWRG